jgi:DNA ligase-associated metallophosphoesterase
MSGHAETVVNGTRLWLLPERVAYLPDEQVLLVADLHLGKGAAFRASGVPVPAGTSHVGLRRLDSIMERHDCRQVIFLGDFYHSTHARHPSIQARVQAWRNRHGNVKCTLVLGNHDAFAGRLPSALAIDVVTRPYLLKGLALQHLPTAHATHHVIAGHTHPVFHLRGRGHQKLRLPCFTSESGMTVLPAFGEFTGGAVVEAAPGRAIYVVTPTRVWPVPCACVTDSRVQRLT